MPVKEKKTKSASDDVTSNNIPTCRERVIIVGRKHARQVFNLPHDVYCEQLGECFCSESDISTSFHGDDGVKRMRIEHKLICSSITVGYGERVSVFRAALACPEIKVALDNAKRWLRLER